jgi:hypothetical protein
MPESLVMHVFFPNVTPAIQANLFFYLSQGSRGLFQELSPVLFHGLLPYKRVLVCFRLYLSAINILFLQTNHALFCQYGDDCIKIKVDALYHMIGSKAVDGRERQSLASTWGTLQESQG